MLPSLIQTNMVWRNKPLGSTTRRDARRGRMARNIVYRLDHNKMVPIEIRCALSHSMIACHSPISWGAHHWMTNLCWQNWRRRRRPDAVAAWPKINVYRLDQNKIDPIEIRCSMIACRCPLISIGCSSLNDTPILAKKEGAGAGPTAASASHAEFSRSNKTTRSKRTKVAYNPLTMITKIVLSSQSLFTLMFLIKKS